MNHADIPGFAEALAAISAPRFAWDVLPSERESVVAEILSAATPVILAAAFADVADSMSEDHNWADGPVLAIYLDAMSHQIRERTGL